MRLRIGGSEALTVPGRRTGNLQRVPVIPVDHDGARYLVSPRGETDWARNLRAAGTGRLGPHGTEVPIRVHEVPVDARANIITAYRAVAGRAVRSFFADPVDPAHHPVFRADPLTSGPPQPRT